jgi:hypothetical protein
VKERLVQVKERRLSSRSGIETALVLSGSNFSLLTAPSGTSSTTNSVAT